MIYNRTNKGKQLTCIETVQKYKSTKHSTLVQIYTSARGIMYKESGAELKINDNLIVCPVESFKQLLAKQIRWIWDFVKFVQFAPNKPKYNKMKATIEDVLKAHDEDGCLITVPNGSVKHMHQMSFWSVLSTADGVHLAISYGSCDGRNSLLRA